MDEIYMDQECCAEFRVDYYSKEPRTVMTCPAEVIVTRQTVSGKTYDKKHMSFFENHGLYEDLTLMHKGLGWFEVVSGGALKSQ